jgi:type IV secretion system protein VirB4
MQFLSALTADARVIAREQRAGSHLPYARQVDDHTVETRDGLLMQVLAIRGLLFETQDTSELNYRKVLRDQMLQAIGTSRFALYHHIVRRRVDVTLDAIFPDDFSTRLDESWKARLAAKQLYVNELYLTLIRRPLQGRLGLVDHVRSLFGKIGRDVDTSARSELRQLNAAREALEASLSSYAPRLLGVYDGGNGLCSEPLEFLSRIFNGETRPVLLASSEIAYYLPYRRVSFGQNAVEHGPYGENDRHFSAIVSVKDYGGQTIPGMFDELLRLPIEMTVSQSFAFVDRQTSLGAMNLAIRRMRSAEDEAVSLRSELAQAKDEVAAGRAAFGEHHMTIAVHIISVREDMALEPAFWAQFPANFKYIGRRGLVSTANFASFVSGHNFAIGTPHHNHWGDAVSLLETSAAGPYFFNFHQKDLGNFTVIGPSGSGKTVILNFLLAQSRKFEPRIVFFDKDRGAELFIRAIGGRYDRLHPDAPSGLNPLQLNDSPSNRQFLVDWLTLLAAGADTEEVALIKNAVDANFEQPKAHQRLRHLVELFRGQARATSGDLWSRMRSWWGDGEHAWLFDNPRDKTDLSTRAVGFDMTAILDDPTTRSPAMLYLFHRVEERLDGTPSIIVVDEGWKALDDDVFVRRIKDWEKTIRKRNGIVGFATQSARDALDSRIASAIIEQAATQIFMVNPKATAEDYMTGFGLSAHELDLVRTLPDNAHCFLIKHGQDSVVVRLDLSGERDLLTILSGRERTVRMLDQLREECGDAPSEWMPRLLAMA